MLFPYIRFVHKLVLTSKFRLKHVDIIVSHSSVRGRPGAVSSQTALILVAPSLVIIHINLRERDVRTGQETGRKLKIVNNARSTDFTKVTRTNGEIGREKAGLKKVNKTPLIAFSALWNLPSISSLQQQSLLLT